MGKYYDFTNQRFGKLLVLERDYNYPKKGTYWRCKCDCGNIISVRRDQLQRGKTSCGCDLAEKNSRAHLKDETGNVYGYLTVIRRMGDETPAKWLCKCKCGNETVVWGNSLRSGVTTSCGCKRYEEGVNMIDEAGNRYGRLTVLYRIGKINSHVQWLCQCDCGNQCVVNGSNLRNGTTKSCGCIGRSYGEIKIKELLDSNNITYIQEYIFPDLKSEESGSLRFDFALLDSNNQVVKLIEFDGKQHFTPIDHFGGQERFERQIKNDNLKNQYCKEHNIPLLRIKYDIDIDKLTIEDLLND